MSDLKLSRIFPGPATPMRPAVAHVVKLWGVDRLAAYLDAAMAHAEAQVAGCAHPLEGGATFRDIQQWTDLVTGAEPIARLEILMAWLKTPAARKAGAVPSEADPSDVQTRASRRVLHAVLGRFGADRIAARLKHGSECGSKRLATIEAEIAGISESRFYTLDDMLATTAGLLYERERLMRAVPTIEAAHRAFADAVATGVVSAIEHAGGLSEIINGVVEALKPKGATAPAQSDAVLKIHAELASIESRLLETPDGWVGATLRSRRAALVAQLPAPVQPEETSQREQLAILLNRAIGGDVSEVQRLCKLLKITAIPEAMQLHEDLQNVLRVAAEPLAVPIFEVEMITEQANAAYSAKRQVA